MRPGKISLEVGNGIEVAGILVGAGLLVLGPTMPLTFPRFLAYAVVWLCFLFFPHGLTHYLLGRLLGVRFQGYSLGKSSISKLGLGIFKVLGSRLVVLTLRVDHASLRAISPIRRAIMFSSGAVASMVLPFLATAASFGRLPLGLSILLLLASVGNLGFDLYYSPKAGDISRAVSALRS